MAEGPWELAWAASLTRKRPLLTKMGPGRGSPQKRSFPVPGASLWDLPHAVSPAVPACLRGIHPERGWQTWRQGGSSCNKGKAPRKPPAVLAE